MMAKKKRLNPSPAKNGRSAFHPHRPFQTDPRLCVSIPMRVSDLTGQHNVEKAKKNPQFLAKKWHKEKKKRGKKGKIYQKFKSERKPKSANGNNTTIARVGRHEDTRGEPQPVLRRSRLVRPQRRLPAGRAAVRDRGDGRGRATFTHSRWIVFLFFCQKHDQTLATCPWNQISRTHPGVAATLAGRMDGKNHRLMTATDGDSPCKPIEHPRE
jgi:hypothetical protein